MATMDTLRAYTILRAQGRFEEHAAQAVSALLAPPLSDLVTKTDLAGVTTELAAVKVDLTAVKTDLATVKTELAAVKTELAAVKTDLAAVKTDLATVKTELKADIEQWRLAMKADLADAKAEWHHRLLLVALTIIGANLTAIAIATGLLLRQLS
jgi:septal ring factor EnvC (AmiA/AmiB activator)